MRQPPSLFAVLVRLRGTLLSSVPLSKKNPTKKPTASFERLAAAISLNLGAAK